MNSSRKSHKRVKKKKKKQKKANTDANVVPKRSLCLQDMTDYFVFYFISSFKFVLVTRSVGKFFFAIKCELLKRIHIIYLTLHENRSAII